jgi:hypothetical protein
LTIISLVLLNFSISYVHAQQSNTTSGAATSGNATGGEAFGIAGSIYCLTGSSCTVVVAPTGGAATSGAATSGAAISGVDTSGSATSEEETGGAPTAQITLEYPQYDVYVNQQKGMIIHIDFNIHELQGRLANVAAYFFYRCDTSNVICQPLKANLDNYRSPVGQVVVSQDFTPKSSSETYNDFQLFIPYRALNIAPGYNTLTYVVCIWNKAMAPPQTLTGSSRNFWFNSPFA